MAAIGQKPQGALALVVSRRFGPLFATQFLSAFNDNALRNALVLMIAYRADAASQLSAQIMIPLAAGLFMLPFFLCSASAGQIADESDKAWLIRLIKLLEIPVMLAAAGGVLVGSATVLLALLFTMGIQAAFFGPLKYAILPDLLGREELLLGNALVEAGTFIAILLGTIAGMLIATRHGAEAVAAPKGVKPEFGVVRAGMLADLVFVDQNPIANFKVLYGTGWIRVNDTTGAVERVGGVKYVMKDGILYDAKKLLHDVETIVQEAKAKEARK